MILRIQNGLLFLCFIIEITGGHVVTDNIEASMNSSSSYPMKIDKRFSANRIEVNGDREQISKTPSVQLLDNDIDYLDFNFAKGWSLWSHWSPCTKTCDRGVRYRLRRCLNGPGARSLAPDSSTVCPAPSKDYQLCNKEPCRSSFPSSPPSSRSSSGFEFRQRQCSSFDQHVYRNVLKDTWTAVEDFRRPCSLTCRASKYGFTVELKKKVVDGTTCDFYYKTSSNALCIDGECTKIGCDDVFNSSLTFDVCNVCGGDGSSCGRRLFVWRYDTKFSRCNPQCGFDRWRKVPLICINGDSNRKVNEQLCDKKDRLPSMRQKCPDVICAPTWVTSPWGECSVSCGSDGARSREVYCVKRVQAASNSTGSSSSSVISIQIPSAVVEENLKVNDWACRFHKKPDDVGHCNRFMCPFWENSAWSECSATCGKGFKMRHVTCKYSKASMSRDLANLACNGQPKPEDKQICYASNICPKESDDHNKYSFMASAPFAQWDDAGSGASTEKEQTDSPYWLPGTWADCSVTCGHGVKTRKIDCVGMQPFSHTLMFWPDYECETSKKSKPSEIEPCHTRRCDDGISGDQSSLLLNLPIGEDSQTHRWEYGSFGPCSASCLGGVQHPTLKCIDKKTNQSADWSECDPSQRPANFTTACNTQACPASWEVREWSPCTHSCGTGTQSRQIRCVKQISHGSSGRIILGDDQCTTVRPVDKQLCGEIDCPPFWTVGKWSECSKSCDTGEQTRSINCQQVTASGETRTLDTPDFCKNQQLDELPTFQLCGQDPCPSHDENSSDQPSSILSDEYSSIAEQKTNKQQQKQKSVASGGDNRKGITLTIGGRATVFENRNVKIKCPLPNADKGRVDWTKDGRPIEQDARIRISKFSALRIFKGKIADNGVYACRTRTGQYSNMTLIFKSRKNESSKYDVVGKAKQSGGTITAIVQQKEKNVGLSPPRKPQVSNFEGNVLMEELKNYLAANNRIDAYAALSRANTIHDVKLSWDLGPWSPCSLNCSSSLSPNDKDRGGQQTTGVQSRSVQCRMEIGGHSSYVPDNACEKIVSPKHHQVILCDVEKCPQWIIGHWSSCEKSRCVRFSTASQKREVYCGYKNGTKVDETKCDRKNRPKLRKECFNKNCMAEWRATDWSQCSKSCGPNGVQMRMLLCVWHGTRKPAGDTCKRGLQRPDVIRECKNNAACPAPGDDDDQRRIHLHTAFRDAAAVQHCQDHSKYCSVVKHMQKCRLAEYSKQCCMTCNLLSKRLKKI